jgi:hypothetical protein
VTPAEHERAEQAQHQAQVEQRMYQFPGAHGWVRRWFIVGCEHPFHTAAEAVQVAARKHERRAAP